MKTHRSLWQTVTGGLVLAFLLHHLPARAATAAPETDAQRIVRAAEDAIRAQDSAAGAALTLSAAALDPRLHLPACDRPLQAIIAGDGQVRGQTAVGVRCAGRVRWTIYVSVTVQTRARVLVARYALPTGASLTSADFRSQIQLVPGLRSAYLTDPAALIGQRLRRALSLGQPLAADALAPAPLVRRGQQVVLLAHGTGIEVRMAGIALSDGRAEDRIPVQNVSSHRIVEGIVRSDSVVEAPL